MIIKLSILSFGDNDEDRNLYINGTVMGNMADLSAQDLIDMLGLDHDVVYASTNEVPMKLEDADVRSTEEVRWCPSAKIVEGN